MANQHNLPPLDNILVDESKAKNNVSTEGAPSTSFVEQTLLEFGLEAKVRNVEHGPRFTRYTLALAPTTKISAIKKVEQDLAVAFSGNLAGVVEPTPEQPQLGLILHHHQSVSVTLGSLITSDAFKKAAGQLKVALGRDIAGTPAVIDITSLPHLLIGGTTGSGKSVCLNAIIASLLAFYTPDQLRCLLIDLTGNELGKYEGLPHLFRPVITQPEATLDVLSGVDSEIDRRYKAFSRQQVRDIVAYNAQTANILPYIVVAVDNIFDLLMTAAKDVEPLVTRMAQRARAAGVHLIFTTPRTRSDAVSGSLKANFPGRIAFQVTDRQESRLILDANGAEDLLGVGDMLYKAPNTTALQRIQGTFVSEAELEKIIGFWRER
ncbi:MAG: DNA translocase FtsK [Chloroflexota bacterium]